MIFMTQPVYVPEKKIFFREKETNNFLSLIFDDLVKRRIMGHCQYTSEYEQSQLVPEKQMELFKI